MRAVLRYLLGGIVAPPPLGVPLLALLGTLAFSSLNLVFQAELWPATPAAPPALELLAGLAALVAAPLLLWWGWGWLRACTGPWWLLLMLKIGFVAALLPLVMGWLLGLVGWVVALTSSHF